MENLDFAKTKKVLLIGAGGKTGIWYSRLMLREGLTVFAFDQNPQVKYPDDLLNNAMFFRVNPDELESGEILKKTDSITLSPGVPLKQDIFIKAQNSGKFVFSELEYTYNHLKNRKWICVTGTDGKSTTVSMIAHCLNVYGKKAVSCGNYGLSFSEIACDKEKYSSLEYLVAELSSYQLELCRNLQADVSLYLNLAPDHLNRYDNLEHYGWVKWHIASALRKNGTLIVNKNLMPGQTKLWKELHPVENIAHPVNIVEVDAENLLSRNFGVKKIDNVPVFYETSDRQSIVKAKELFVQGEHNFSNILFCLETLYCLGCRDRQKLAAALETFKSLPHRFEKIILPDSDGNIYINDSKATTTQAVIIAIKNTGLPLFLFLGGRSKGEDYGFLAETIAAKGAHVFLFGENRKELEVELLRHKVSVVGIKDTLDQAFAHARDYQKENRLENVTFLLSPASTSWDQYSSFEERGDKFRQMVLKA